MPAVTPAEDGHLFAVGLEKAGQAGGHRGLAGAAHRQVADAHHPGGQVFGQENLIDIETAPEARPQAVNHGQPPGHHAQGTPGRRGGLAPPLETIKEVVEVGVHVLY